MNLNLGSLMSSTKRTDKQREWERKSKAKKRLEDKQNGLVLYQKVIKKEYVPLMDTRLAELNKTGV